MAGLLRDGYTNGISQRISAEAGRVRERRIENAELTQAWRGLRNLRMVVRNWRFGLILAVALRRASHE